MFSETVNTAQRKKIAYIPAFTERLPLGKLCIITTFASSFLAFSFIFSDSEFKYIQENSRFPAFIDKFRHGKLSREFKKTHVFKLSSIAIPALAAVFY